MIRAAVRQFFRRESGGATVETVLWFPLIFAIFGLMVDTAMVFYGQTKALRIVQEGNREFSVGRLTTAAATEDYVESVLSKLNIAVTATTTVSGGGVATTTVAIPARQLQVLGFFTAFNSLVIRVTAEHMIENWEV